MQLQKALERYDERLGIPFESYYKIMLYGWRSNENKRRRMQLLGNDELLIESVDERTDIEREVEGKLLWEKALGELGKLSEAEQYIIRKYYLEGRSLIDIASGLGVKYKNVEFKKGVALKKLRQRLSQSVMIKPLSKEWVTFERGYFVELDKFQNGKTSID